MPLESNPRRLYGPWTEGYALDYHTISSSFVGYNAFGHPEFSTTRSQLGELLYRLKFNGDISTLDPIVETVVSFISSWNVPIDQIVVVPPSNTRRKVQPVILIATGIGSKLGLNVCESCVVKIKNTAQLKNIFEREQRDKLLDGVFDVRREFTQDKRLLLFDDLYRSGATASAVTEALQNAGAAASVYFLTLTQTRRNL